MQGVEVQCGCSYWGSHRGSLRVEGYLQLLGSFPTQTELCLMYLKKSTELPVGKDNLNLCKFKPHLHL